MQTAIYLFFILQQQCEFLSNPYTLNLLHRQRDRAAQLFFSSSLLETFQLLFILQETATEFWDVIDEYQNNYFVYLVCCCMLKFGFCNNLTKKWPVASNCKIRLLLYLSSIILKYIIHLSSNRNLHTIFHQLHLSFLFLFMFTIEE